jgi:hypothetical protein
MKRNWDTIRGILIRLEALDPETGALQLGDFPTDKAYEYSYHVELLIEARLIYGHMSKTIGRHAQNFLAQRLTWQGHEFLDAIRSDTVWNKTKTTFFKDGLSMTFDLVMEVAKDVAVSVLKSAVGS